MPLIILHIIFYVFVYTASITIKTQYIRRINGTPNSMRIHSPAAQWTSTIYIFGARNLSKAPFCIKTSTLTNASTPFCTFALDTQQKTRPKELHTEESTVCQCNGGSIKRITDNITILYGSSFFLSFHHSLLLRFCVRALDISPYSQPERWCHISQPLICAHPQNANANPQFTTIHSAQCQSAWTADRHWF